MHEETSTQASYNSKHFFTPLEEAVAEIHKRRGDEELVKKVYAYLNGDIPEHFTKEQPILYLSRHIATPNYEALRFIELCKPYNLPLVIGQDKKGKFVSHNELKKALGKMPVTKGISRRQDEIIENFTIVDFSQAQGVSFQELQTRNGGNFVEFHNNLFQYIYPNEIEIVDESAWVDRNHRDDLEKQYKKLFALLCVYGVMFESYPESETSLVQSALAPAFAEIEKVIGVKPLIVENIDSELELTRDWNGYPSVLYQFIKNDLCEK